MVPRVGQLSPSEERIWDLRDVECSFPVGDKRPPEPLVSVSPRLLSLPFWPLAASEPTFRQLWPLPFVLSSSLFFFSPLSLSLSWNLLLSPLLSLSPLASIFSIWESGHWATTASLLSACETCTFWPAVSDKQRRGLPHTSQTLVQCSLSGDLQGERGLNLISCNAWKCNCPNILTFIFLPPREVPLGTGSSGRFLHSGVHMGESPIYGLFYRQRTTDWFLGLITLVGSGRVLPPSLALSESAQVSVWIDMGNLSFSFSVFSVLPPFTSSIVFTPALWTPLSWKVLVCVQVLWLISLCSSFVCSSALASLYCHCGYSGALKPWNTNIAHIAWDSGIGLLSGILKNKKKRQELASLSPLSLQCNYSAWVFRNYL